jgi:RNA polymerase sigma factor (sigma-70 family)
VNQDNLQAYCDLCNRHGLRHPSAVHLRNRIVEDNLGLARQVANRYHQKCSLDYCDLEQIACLGLIKAIEAFDPSTRNALSSYAIPVIRGEILHYLRDSASLLSGTRWLEKAIARGAATPFDVKENARAKFTRDLDGYVGQASDGDRLALHEVIAAKPIETSELSIVELTANLPPDLRWIVRLRHSGDGVSFKSIARVAGVGAMTVSRRYVKAIVILRRLHCPQNMGAEIKRTSYFQENSE